MRDYYTDKMHILHTNNKSKGSMIVNLDTIRGCKNNCESCFAKKNSCKSIRHYEEPVKVNYLLGQNDPSKFYRFGNFGDPATDWQHSEDLITKYNIKNTFFVTKLQSIEGYTGFLQNLQVSVDPLNEEHFYITLKNINKLISKFSNISIVMRVRSVSTLNTKINELQEKAVQFTNSKQIPILETRIRFTTKEKAIHSYLLNIKDYSFRGGYLRPNYGTRFLKNVNHHYICDEKELKCKGCNNCIKLLNWNTDFST